MPVVVCPECERKLQLPESALAKEARCPMCGADFVAEEAQQGGRGVCVRPLREAESLPVAPVARRSPRDRGNDDDRDQPRRSMRTGTILILVLVGLGVVAGLAVGGYFIVQKFGGNSKRIVGDWQMVEGMPQVPGQPMQLVFRFTEDGKITFLLNGNPFMASDMTYRVSGDTLEVSQGGTRASEKSRILTLTDTDLVLEDAKSKQRVKFRRLATRTGGLIR